MRIARYALVFNRMSPSAYLRGRGHSILYTQQYLAHLEQLGVRVVNGTHAFRQRNVEGAATVAAEVARTCRFRRPA